MKKLTEFLSLKKKSISIQVGIAISFTVVALFAMGAFGITMYHLFTNRMEAMMSENAVQRGGYAYAGELGDFYYVYPLKRGCQGQNKNFLNQVWYKCGFSFAMRLSRLFQAEKRPFEPGLVQKID